MEQGELVGAMRLSTDEDREDVRVGEPVFAAVVRLATTATAEEDEFFWRNFLLMLTELKRFGWGIAKGEAVGAGGGGAGVGACSWMELGC